MRSYLLAALVVLMSAQAAPPEIVALTSIPSPPPVFEQSPLTPAQSTRISEKA
jgi:hypothetical protein